MPLRHRRPVRVETLDRLQPPGLPLGALGLRPQYRLPVGRQNKPRSGIGDFDAVAARLVDVEEEGLLHGVFVRAGLDEDAVLQKNIRRAEHVFARVERVGDVMEARGCRCGPA